MNDGERLQCALMVKLPNLTLLPYFQVISAVQRHSQTRVQWSIVLDEAFHLEDVATSQNCSGRYFTHSFPSDRRLGWLQQRIWTPTVGEFSRWQPTRLTPHYVHLSTSQTLLTSVPSRL